MGRIQKFDWKRRKGAGTVISDHRTEAHVSGEWIEVPVVVEQVITALDTPSGDDRVYGLANSDADTGPLRSEKSAAFAPR